MLKPQSFRWDRSRATGYLGTVLRGIGNPAQGGRSAAQLDAESVVLDHMAGNGPFVLSARLTLASE